MAAFYAWAGINHFKNPRFYLKMMPDYIPNHQLMVDLSGIVEILVAVGLLFGATRSISAWIIIAMLVAFLPVHWYMATSGNFPKISPIFLWLRFPMQVLLIWWTYQYV